VNPTVTADEEPVGFTEERPGSNDDPDAFARTRTSSTYT